jgi:hypothetical protein
VWALGLVYAHPLVALWILDRELMRSRPEWRKAYHTCLLALPLLLGVLWWHLAASPQLHARFHADAGSSSHECAVTLIASGKYEQADAPPVLCAPQPAVVFEKIPALAPVWVAAPFLRASIFEHAPPALS